MTTDRTPAQNIPGFAVFTLVYKGGEPVTSVVRALREPLTDEQKSQGCAIALHDEMKRVRGTGRRAKDYVVKYERFEPERVYREPETTAHEYKGVVLQDAPLICVEVRPFMANNAKEAWEEAVRRVKAAYRPQDVREEMLYGGVTATGNPDDKFDVDRPAGSNFRFVL